MKIFISIASYRDMMLKKTIENAYENAYYKDSLVFGVFDQNYKESQFNFSDLPYKNNINYVRIDPQYARGACWARHIVQTLYNNEDYYFQIDAHTIFDPNWDKRFIDQMELLQQYHNKPVITGFPHVFNIDSNLDVTETFPIESNKTMVICINPSESKILKSDNYNLTMLSKTYNCPGPVHGYLISGGNIFSHGTIVEEMPYDPFMYFHGEEQSLALRFFTHGYNIFHISQNPVYHLYSSASFAINTRFTHWGDGKVEESRNIKWDFYSSRAHNRLIDLSKGKIQSVYGLGNVRSLDQYAIFTGINYKDGGPIERRAGDGYHIYSLDYREKIENYCTLSSSNNHWFVNPPEITIPLADLIKKVVLPDAIKYYIVFDGYEINMLYSIMMSKEETDNILSNHSFTFSNSKDAVKAVVFGITADDKWSDRVEYLL
jgi:hypothetical protein